MHWAAVIVAAYTAGLVEFWRLCRFAPVLPDGRGDAQASRVEHTEQPQKHPAQKADPSNDDDKNAGQDQKRGMACHQPLAEAVPPT
jgi:hypothetical protein